MSDTLKVSERPDGAVEAVTMPSRSVRRRASGPWSWFESRTGLGTMLRSALHSPVPRADRFRYALGAALGAAFVVELVTGLLLMAGYSPSVESAWGSTYFIDQVLAGGWFVRGLHSFAAHAMIVVAACYLFYNVISAAIFAPREVHWWLGLALLGILIGFTLTGNALPWDQDGYWAWSVETGIAGGAPVLGPAMQRLIVGGTALGNGTLGRLYALHVGLLPILALVIIRSISALNRRHARDHVGDAEPSWPRQTFRNLIAAGSFLGLVSLLVLVNGGVALEAPADSSSQFPARPAWFFLWLFELRKSFPGSQEILATMVIPGALVTVLLMLPFLDRLVPRGVAHLLATGFLFTVLGGAGYLTVQAIRADQADPHYVEGIEEAEAARTRAFDLAAEGLPPDGASAMMTRDPVYHGKPIFQAKCQGCHAYGGLRGEGGGLLAAELKGFGTAPWVRDLLENPDAPGYFGPIRRCDPKLAGMAQWRRGSGKDLTSEELDQLADFVASFAAIPADLPMSVWENSDAVQNHPGYALYNEQCIDCHIFGEADEANFGPNLYGWGSPWWFRRIVREPGAPDLYGVVESSCQMPSYADQMTETDIDTVYRYLRGGSR